MIFKSQETVFSLFNAASNFIENEVVEEKVIKKGTYRDQLMCALKSTFGVNKFLQKIARV